MCVNHVSTGVDIISEMLNARHAVHTKRVGVMSFPTRVSAKSKIADQKT